MNYETLRNKYEYKLSKKNVETLKTDLTTTFRLINYLIQIIISPFTGENQTS